MNISHSGIEGLFAKLGEAKSDDTSVGTVCHSFDMFVFDESVDDRGCSGGADFEFIGNISHRWFAVFVYEAEGFYM